METSRCCCSLFCDSDAQANAAQRLEEEKRTRVDTSRRSKAHGAHGKRDKMKKEEADNKAANRLKQVGCSHSRADPCRAGTHFRTSECMGMNGLECRVGESLRTEC